VSLPTGASTSALQTTLNGHVDGVEALLGGTLVVGGNVAHDAADSGNPIKVGGKYNATMNTITDGDRGDLQLGLRGRLLIGHGLTFQGADDVDNTTVVYPAGNNAGDSNGGPLMSASMLFDGTGWDRQRSDANGNTITVGNVASGAADSGSPVKTGCVYNTTLPSPSTGQRVDTQCASRGETIVFLQNGSAQGAAYAAMNVDGVTASATANRLQTTSLAYALNNAGTWDRVRGDANALAVAPGLTATSWSYSNGATGILSNTTTAVTIKTAAGGSVRNFIDSCSINTTAFGASVPVAIRDGAGGTVLWAHNVPTAGFLQPVNIHFAMPLRGTANTLLEVVTPTANTSGTVWLNCQGHTGI
jgi:hypothetical protein